MTCRGFTLGSNLNSAASGNLAKLRLQSFNSQHEHPSPTFTLLQSLQGAGLGHMCGSGAWAVIISIV